MKKQVFLLLVALLAMFSSAFAYDFSAMAPSGHTLFYKIVSGKAQVTPQNSTSPYYSFSPTGSLIIPDSITYNGTTYAVTSICQNTFQNCSGLTSVTIPSTITSIGNNAFSGCSGLTSVNYIGTIAQWCSINFALYANPVSCAHSLSINGVPINSLIIPDGISTIKDYAFEECYSLTSVTIPSGVTSIGKRAFRWCRGLTSVIIPSSVISIGEYAFFDCNSLSVSIPQSVTSIGTSAFAAVRHIEYYGSASGVPWGACTMNGFKDGDFYYSDATKQTLVAYSGYGGDVIIPSTVNTIGVNAFSYCGNLTSVTIPNSVTSIYNYAFRGCTGLTSVAIPSSVTTMEGGVFSDCSNLSVIWMKHTTPPSSFNFNDHTINIVVPHNSYTSYTQAGNCYTNHNLYKDSVFVTTIVNNTTEGYIVSDNLSLSYPYVDTVTLTAIPYYGYHFYFWKWKATSATSWNMNDYDYTDSIRLITNITSDITVMASFAINQYNISLDVDSSIHGSCMGAGTYDYLSEPTIAATAENGYHFTHWSDGITDNPRIITLTQDTSIIAHFERNSYIVTVLSNNETMGSAIGGDTVLYLDSVTISATANQGHHFVKWNENNTDNPRTVQVTSDATYTAQFTYNQYTITLNVDTSIHGTCTGGGNYNYLSNRTIRANASSGYHFMTWNDGITDNPRTITLTQDTQFVAYFAKNSYTLTFQSNNSAMGVVDTPSVSGEYLDTTIWIHATPISHYHFVRWNDNNTENPRRFVFNNNHTYTAYFAIDVHTVGLQVDNMAHGTVSGAGTCNYGQSVTVSATPYDGYQFSHWSDGSTYNPYTLAVIDDVQLTAYFYATGTPYQDTIYIDTLFLYDTTYIDVHDTTYIDVPYPVHDTTVIHDTSYVDVYVPVHDTTIIHDTTIVVQIDTLVVTDTLIVTDTLTLYDTIIFYDTIYDTIYIAPAGIGDVQTINAKIYQCDGKIVVEGADGNTVMLYDVNGRVLATKQDDYTTIRFDAPASGTYMIKIGNHPARKVVVIR